MNGTFDVSGTAGSVYGIVGTGISLGVLAGMSSMVMRSARGLYDPYGREEKETYRRRPARKKTTTKRRRAYEYEEERPRGFYSLEGPRGLSRSHERPMRLNLPRYW